MIDSWKIGHLNLDQVTELFLSYIAERPDTIVCFDYFDTLITRTVQPEFTKQLAASSLSLLINGLCTADRLYEIRRDLEKEMCEESLASGGELEFYLQDFAPRFLVLLRNENGEFPIGWDDKQFTKLILDIELTVEKKVQEVCADTAGILKSLKDAGCRTVLISDFYLPSSHFIPMMEHHDLADLFDHIYVSADYGLAKGSGRLYDKVISDLGCDPENMVMIGDNPHSDVSMANERGIKSVFLENPEKKDFYSTWNRDEHLTGNKVAERFSRGNGASVMFSEMGFSLWFFISRLVEELLSRQVSNVFFFSKEGEFLKRLFDRYQEDLFGQQVINSHYLLVSRKATFLASLRPLEEEDFSRLFNYYRDISLRDFLLSLNLEESIASGICEDVGLEYETRHHDFPNHPDFLKLKSSDVFRDVYEVRRSRQRQNLKNYIESFKVDYNDEGLTIVDVGWKGSIQDNLYHVFDKEVAFTGYYVGSLIAPNKSENNLKNGLLFDDSPAPGHYFDVFNNNRSLFEMVLGATHGSADGYFTEEEFESLPADHKKVVARSIDTGNGELNIATLDLPEERELFNEQIKPLQDHYYSTFVALNNAFGRSQCLSPQPEWFAKQHARMVFKPEKGEIDFFERLYHLENFGVFEYTNFQAGSRLPMKQRLKNLLNIMRDRQVLESGIWPPIILRRLGLGKYRHVDGAIRHRKAFGTGSKVQ